MDPVNVKNLLELIEKTNVMPPEAGLTDEELQAIKDKARADIAAEIAG